MLESYDRNVPIVPVGLNYFRGHRFRGRIVVEFGQPIFIDKDTLIAYKESKRLGLQSLLSQVLYSIYCLYAGLYVFRWKKVCEV